MKGHKPSIEREREKSFSASRLRHRRPAREVQAHFRAARPRWHTRTHTHTDTMRAGYGSTPIVIIDFPWDRARAHHPRCRYLHSSFVRCFFFLLHPLLKERGLPVLKLTPGNCDAGGRGADTLAGGAGMRVRRGGLRCRLIRTQVAGSVGVRLQRLEMLARSAILRILESRAAIGIRLESCSNERRGARVCVARNFTRMQIDMGDFEEVHRGCAVYRSYWENIARLL